MDSWTSEAACRTEAGFLALEYHDAKKVCDECPVAKQCLKDAIEHERGRQLDEIFFIRGGVSARRRKLMLSALAKEEEGRQRYSQRQSQTECQNGHPFDDENTIIKVRNGAESRECRQCRKAYNRDYARQRRQKQREAKKAEAL